VGRGFRRGHVQLEDQLVRGKRRHVAVLRGRQAVELRDRKLALRRAQRRVQRDERRTWVRWMRGRALVVAKDRVLAVSAVLGKATLSPVQPALEAEPPVPAAGGLEEVPTDRAHRAQLWRRRLGAGFAESLRDLYIDLELGERRSRTDAVRVDAAGHDPGDMDERLGVRKAVTEQRHELGPAGERPRAVAERGGGFVGARRPQELHGALFRVPRARGARAATSCGYSLSPLLGGLAERAQHLLACDRQ